MAILERFDCQMPEPGNPSSSSGQGLDDEDRALLEKVEAGFEAVGDLYNACKFRAALVEALGLACVINGDAFGRSMLARDAAVAKQLPS